MAELKTQKTKANANDLIEQVEDDQKKKDSLELMKIFSEVTGEKPVMWGTSIIGFGQYHYKSERSKQEGDWPLVAFSPRKANITLYIMAGFGEYQDLLKKIGKHKTSTGSCLYIKRLSDIDVDVLKKLIKLSFQHMKVKHGVK